MKKREVVDLTLILLWPIAASLLSFLINANTLVSTLLFFGLPSAYLSWRKPAFIKKVAIFSLILSIPVAIFFDYIMEVTGGWYLPHSVFDPYRLFGFVVLEQFIWLFLYAYFIAIFSETFLERHKPRTSFDKHLKYLAIIMWGLLGIFLILYFSNPALLRIDYFYLKIGIVLGLIPIIIGFIRMPTLIARFFITGAYFFILSLIYELTALALGQWSFPAEKQFIGMLNFGGLRFPFEEFFFWILLGAMATLTWYEFFADDEK